MSEELNLKDVVVVDKNIVNTDKDTHVKNFITALIAVDKELTEIRESRKDLIKDYIDNKYLTKEEIKILKQAMGLAKKAVDPEDITKYFKVVMGLI